MLRSRILIALAVGASALAATSVIAADDPIAARQQIMKNNGAAMGILSKMAEGEVAFDATAAMLAFTTISSGSIGVGELFPEGSETGGQTRAAPAIWEDMDGFQATVAKFQADTAAALAAPPQSQDELVAARGAVGANCGGCHDKFRLAKQ
jgi:cytochrome c556